MEAIAERAHDALDLGQREQRGGAAAEEDGLNAAISHAGRPEEHLVAEGVDERPHERLDSSVRVEVAVGAL